MLLSVINLIKLLGLTSYIERANINFMLSISLQSHTVQIRIQISLLHLLILKQKRDNWNYQSCCVSCKGYTIHSSFSILLLAFICLFSAVTSSSIRHCFPPIKVKNCRLMTTKLVGFFFSLFCGWWWSCWCFWLVFEKVVQLQGWTTMFKASGKNSSLLQHVGFLHIFIKCHSLTCLHRNIAAIKPRFSTSLTFFY